MSISNRVHLNMISLVHETLYGLFRDATESLDAAGLQPGQDVLEVGCGPGFFTIPAARIVGEDGSVCALDINPLAVQKVEEKTKKAGVSNVKTVLADAARTGLPQQGFDLIFVFGFDHSPGNRENILVELHRILKPGGILTTEGRLWPASQLLRPVKRQGNIFQFERVG